jgi:tetrahydromethanopterin S-methyltransferase subunit B
LGLFAYVIYKFKKEGVVAVIYFLGSVAAAVHHNLIIGIVLALIAILLSIKWKIWPFSPAGKQTSS